MEIPRSLIEQVREGKVVLFLGWGAAKDADHPQGRQPPDAVQLSSLLADKFLGREYIGRPLDQVAALAISETDILTVQAYIAAQFNDFYPADFHKLIPTFVWSAIATTNHDLIVERAYEAVLGRCQTPVPFIRDGQRVEDRLRMIDSVMFLKLHGCITKIDDTTLPLILTPEQYITHRANRNRLFERLREFAQERPMLFVGHSLADMDLRLILNEITSLNAAMPRSYLVAPNVADADQRYWASRKITCLVGTFKDFITSLDQHVPTTFRRLAVATQQAPHPIVRRFASATTTQPSGSLLEFLSDSADYIHSALATPAPNAKAFYRGSFADWSAIVNNLDVSRSVADTIITDNFLEGEEARASRQDLIVLRGPAGSGKSVTLHRTAWEAATEYDKLCIFVKPSGGVAYENIREMYSLTKQRIFLFIEPASDHREAIVQLLLDSRRERVPLTIVTAERPSEWHGALTSFVTREYDLRYLSGTEIDELLVLLARHKSLGHLEDLTLEQRREALSKRAGRQLLVALHEATLGKAFSDIIFDEYESISSEEAKTLYRTVCILHRLGVHTRAGLVSRVHGIPFKSFEESLFKPLSYIVFAEFNEKIRDFVYRSRHPYIADMVIERALIDPKDRFDEYMRIIKHVDVDYEADRVALRDITNARQLRSLFFESNLVRPIFDVAKERDPANSYILQQEAIFEMGAPDGDFSSATDLLQRAKKLSPRNTGILHSLAELNLKKSSSALRPVEKDKYREEARSIATGLVNGGANESHPYHTLLKIALEELVECIGEGSDDVTSGSTKKINEVESLLSKANQRFPGDSYILDSEAQLSEILGRHPRGLAALEAAFTKDKRSPYIASRLAKLHERAGRVSSAIQVLKDSLEANPAEKSIHYRLATLLSGAEGSDQASIKYHLRHAFTKGDAHYEAQFRYARLEYLDGNIVQAMEIFEQLERAPVAHQIRMRTQGEVMGLRFAGVVTKLGGEYVFITRDGNGSRVYASGESTDAVTWDGIRYRSRVTFELAFNYVGPVALRLKREQ
jgi:tetratricopeptide (TPR) repeat protein